MLFFHAWGRSQLRVKMRKEPELELGRVVQTRLWRCHQNRKATVAVASGYRKTVGGAGIQCIRTLSLRAVKVSSHKCPIGSGHFHSR